MNDEIEQLFLRLISERKIEDNLTKRERKKLKQPVTRVRIDNVFTWHLNRYTVFEDETDPDLIKNGIFFRRVGITEGGRLTEDKIVTHEERLGIRLPEPWRNVYKHFNGGWAHTLYWGDMNNPRMNDIEPIPQSNHEYLALEDVAPLRDLLPTKMEGLDCSSLDPRLIAIACADSQAVLLDYRKGEIPRICCAFFDKYDNDPLSRWENDEFTFWWPNIEVFFRGLYLQDRII